MKHGYNMRSFNGKDTWFEQDICQLKGSMLLSRDMSTEMKEMVPAGDPSV